ncbi:MAG: hypothetical protein ACE5LD_05035 [Candidatus Bipolaricaulia bacterium]
MSRVLLLLALLLLGGAAGGQAQPLTPGGGPALGWLPLGFTGLNEHLALAGLPGLGEGLLLVGANYFGDRRDGFDIGGLMVIGQSEATRLDKSVRLSLLVGGPTLEYGEPVDEQMGVFVGGLVAPARLTLEVTLHPAEDFDSGLQKPSGTSFARSFFVMELYAGGEWALGGQRLRLSLGYLWAAGMSNWLTDGRDLPGPLERFSGPLVQAVFVFGI